MKKLLSTILFAMVLTSSAYAGKNPIGWSITPATGLPATSVIGNNYSVEYTFINNLPFAKFLKPMTISTSGGFFSYSENCSNRTLSPNGTCVFNLGLKPSQAGTNSAVVTLHYDNNVVPLPTLSTTTASQATSSVIGEASGLPHDGVTIVGSTYNVAFTFTNNGATVTGLPVLTSGFTVTGDTCSNQPLVNGHPCRVSGTFTPTTTGLATLSTTYRYGTTSVPVTVQTHVHSGGVGCLRVDGAVALELPGTTFVYADNVVKFVFTNNCSVGSATLGTVTTSVTNGSAVLTNTVNAVNGCASGTVLAPHAFCYVYASAIPQPGASQLQIQASMPYTGSATPAVVRTNAVTVSTNNSAIRNVIFVNQCSDPVWIGVANGPGYADPTNATTPNDYMLQGMSTTGGLPSTKIVNYSSSYVGGFWFPRTGCNLTGSPLVCQTGSCTTDSKGKCLNQPTVPYTKTEDNFPSATGSDGLYDVSMINGFNVPMEMKGLNPTSNGTSSTLPLQCTAAGGMIQPTGSLLGSCSWSFTPSSSTSGATANDLYWVTAGADTACTSNSDCTVPGEVCGTAYTAKADNSQLNRRCGVFIGYWTVNNYCGLTGTWGSKNEFTFFSCANPLTIPPYPSGTNGDLQRCVPQGTAIGDCYSAVTNGPQCCGCVNWNVSSGPERTYQAYNCFTSNTDWISGGNGALSAYQNILWLKQACPTAYSYPDDDTSTQFNCNVTNQYTSYQITFCPGGKNGAPGT